MNGAGHIYLIIFLNFIGSFNFTRVEGIEFPPKCTNENKTVYLRTESYALPQPAAALFSNLTLNECANRCTAEYDGIKCRSFEYNSAIQSCALKKGCAQPVGTVILTNSRRSDTAFFQQICIPTTRLCSAPYTFERIPQHTLVDHAIQMFTTNSLSACLLNCLEWRQLRRMECRSAMYFYDTRECALSRETRKSVAPEFFSAHPKFQLVDYFENNCFDVDCFEDAHLHWIQVEEFQVDSRYDLIFNAISANECRKLCMKNRMNSEAFPCKAFVYSSVKRECQLSASSGVKPMFTDGHTLPFAPMDFPSNSIGIMPKATLTSRSHGSHFYQGTKISLLKPIVPINHPLMGRFSDERLPQTNIRFASGRRIESDLAVPSLSKLSVFENGHYYEKICLVGIPKCEEASFELVPHRMLQIREKVLPISSVSACLEQCLLLMSNCSSVMFFRHKNECVINQQTRFSDPELFHEAEDVNYYDNLCQLTVESFNRNDRVVANSALSEETSKNNKSNVLESFRVVFKMTSANLFSENISPPFTTPLEVVGGAVTKNSVKPKRTKPIFSAEMSADAVLDNMIETECRRSEVLIKAVLDKMYSGVFYLRDNFEECAVNFVDAREVLLKLPQQNSTKRPNCTGTQLNENVWSYILVLKRQTTGEDEISEEFNRTFNVTCDFTNNVSHPLSSLASDETEIVEQNFNENLHENANHQDSPNTLNDLKNDSIQHYPQIQMFLLQNGRSASNSVNLGEELEIRWVFSTLKSSTFQSYTVNDASPVVDDLIGQEGIKAIENKRKMQKLLAEKYSAKKSGILESVSNRAKLAKTRLKRESSHEFDSSISDKKKKKARKAEHIPKLDQFYGCFVENCTAERLGGVSDTPMTLPLIVNGCPSHFAREKLIRSPITELPDGSGLRTTLKAFRFEGSLRVRIRCSINICVERCEPVLCHNTTPSKSIDEQMGFASFGRRKKRYSYDRSSRFFHMNHKQNNGQPIQQSTITGSYSILDSNSRPISTPSQTTTQLAFFSDNFLTPISPIVDHNRRQPNFHQGLSEKVIRKSSQRVFPYSGGTRDGGNSGVNIDDGMPNLAQQQGFIRQDSLEKNNQPTIKRYESNNYERLVNFPRLEIPSASVHLPSSQHFKDNFLPNIGNDEKISAEETKTSICLRRGVFIALLVALSFLGTFQMFYLCRTIRRKFCTNDNEKNYSPTSSFGRRHNPAQDTKRETPIYDSVRDAAASTRNHTNTTTSPYFITKVGPTNEDQMYTKYFYKISGDIAESLCSIDSLQASPDSTASNLNSESIALKQSYLSFNSFHFNDQNVLAQNYVNTKKLRKTVNVARRKSSEIPGLDSSSFEIFNYNLSNVATSYSIVPLWKPSKNADIIYANINSKK